MDTRAGKLRERHHRSLELTFERPVIIHLLGEVRGAEVRLVKQIFGIIKKINAENNTTIFLVEQNANLALVITSYSIHYTKLYDLS